MRPPRAVVCLPVYIRVDSKSPQTTQSRRSKIYPQKMSSNPTTDPICLESANDDPALTNADMDGIAVAVASESDSTIATYFLDPDQYLGR